MPEGLRPPLGLRGPEPPLRAPFAAGGASAGLRGGGCGGRGGGGGAGRGRRDGERGGWAGSWRAAATNNSNNDNKRKKGGGADKNISLMLGVRRVLWGGKGRDGGRGRGEGRGWKALPPSPPLPSWVRGPTLPLCASCERSSGLYTAVPASRGAHRSPSGDREGLPALHGSPRSATPGFGDAFEERRCPLP